MEEYIGSQQHFEDTINDYYDERELHESQQELDYKQEMKAYYDQMEKDYYDQMETEYYEQMEREYRNEQIRQLEMDDEYWA